MKLLVTDYKRQGDALISKFYIDGEFASYGLEDWPEGDENRIKRGTYKLQFRREGETHAVYEKKFPLIHKGMIQVIVPGRRWILHHIGNKAVHTRGCYLYGTTNNKFGEVENSTAAYLRVYPRITAAMEKGEVEITYAEIPIQ